MARRFNIFYRNYKGKDNPNRSRSQYGQQLNRYAQVLAGEGSAEQAVKRIESVLNNTTKGQPNHGLVNSLRESSRTANTEQKVFESKIPEAPMKTPVKQDDSKVN